MSPRALLLAAAAPLLGACADSWFGDDSEETLPGERISVLVFERALEADPALEGEPVTLPEAIANDAWPVPWMVPSHAPGPLAAGEDLAVEWRRGLGAGETDENIILSAPAIADGHAFALDAESTAVALRLDSGARAWTRGLVPENEDDDASLGGGVAFADGVLYAATAFGEIAALDAATGAVLWRRAVGGVFRAAPAVADGRVFAIAADNRLFALDAAGGEPLWTHEGIVESAGLLGAAVPAVSGDLVLAAYSSGELFALRVENGRVAWSDSLIIQGRIGARASLSDIDASPVVDGGVAFAVSGGGSLAAIDMRSGLRVWEREIPGIRTPWIAGDYLWLVTADAELVCLRRADGRARWVTALPRHEDPEDREDPILWSGPVLAGGRLAVAGSHGELRWFSPHDGAALGVDPVSGGVRVPPVVAGGAMFVLTREADLVALR